MASTLSRGALLHAALRARPFAVRAGGRAAMTCLLRGATTSAPRRGFVTTRARRSDDGSDLRSALSQSFARATTPTPRIWSFGEIERLIEDSAPSATPTAVLIDVREPNELVHSGRIPGAVNIPLKSHPDSYYIGVGEFEERFGFARPHVNQPVVFYCHAGVRAHAAAELARMAGWRQVGEFPGSWIEWTDKGGRIEKGE